MVHRERPAVGTTTSGVPFIIATLIAFTRSRTGTRIRIAHPAFVSICQRKVAELVDFGAIVARVDGSIEVTEARRHGATVESRIAAHIVVFRGLR